MTEIAPRPLSPADFITVWEIARPASPSVRTLEMLRAILPENAYDQIANWCIGEGDAFLLKLHRTIFGSHLECATSCPACATALELTFEIESLLTNHGSGADAYQVILGTPPQVIFFRLPNHADLQALPSREAPDFFWRLLIERCVLYAERDGVKISPVPLSDEMMAAVSEAMSRVDPQAEILLNLRCPDCMHDWQTAFDIADFVWREISARARRLLAEIHCLAQAYGWTESEILALSEARRQIYLELVGS